MNKHKNTKQTNERKKRFVWISHWKSFRFFCVFCVSSPSTFIKTLLLLIFTFAFLNLWRMAIDTQKIKMWPSGNKATIFFPWKFFFFYYEYHFIKQEKKIKFKAVPGLVVVIKSHYELWFFFFKSTSQCSTDWRIWVLSILKIDALIKIALKLI